MDAEGVLALYDRHARELLGFFSRRTPDPPCAGPRLRFQAPWSVKMSDGRVLTPQQLQVNLGIPGGGGG